MYVYTCRSLRSNSSFGGVLKRLKRPHLKCGRSVSSRRVGSNPTSSAFGLQQSYLCSLSSECRYRGHLSQRVRTNCLLVFSLESSGSPATMLQQFNCENTVAVSEMELCYGDEQYPTLLQLTISPAVGDRSLASKRYKSRHQPTGSQDQTNCFRGSNTDFFHRRVPERRRQTL